MMRSEVYIFRSFVRSFFLSARLSQIPMLRHRNAYLPFFLSLLSYFCTKRRLLCVAYRPSPLFIKRSLLPTYRLINYKRHTHKHTLSLLPSPSQASSNNRTRVLRRTIRSFRRERRRRALLRIPAPEILYEILVLIKRSLAQ